ncbi:Smr/MutS family protein [Alcaligenaceae bacterium CGII-47]|nr:Smr/MutS family protein [Alcaligenaceae bacterium CGII-47]
MTGTKPAQGRPHTAPLSAEDRALFQQHTQDVHPIPRPQRQPASPTSTLSDQQIRERRRRATGEDAFASPTALRALSDHFQAAQLRLDEGSFLQTGYGPDLLLKLKQGKWPIEASLDLHGATLDQARERLDRFLATCLAHQIKCVCIVHGKGYGSRNGKPVLKDTIRRWLSQLVCVRAYIECHEHHGGSGAVQVLLRINPAPGDPP